GYYWYQAEGVAQIAQATPNDTALDTQEVYIAVETQKNMGRWQEICNRYNQSLKRFYGDRFVRFNCLEGAKLKDHEILTKPECINTTEDGDLLNGCNS